jgi:hypothetical protein
LSIAPRVKFPAYFLIVLCAAFSLIALSHLTELFSQSFSSLFDVARFGSQMRYNKSNGKFSAREHSPVLRIALE